MKSLKLVFLFKQNNCDKIENEESKVAQRFPMLYNLAEIIPSSIKKSLAPKIWLSKLHTWILNLRVQFFFLTFTYLQKDWPENVPAGRLIGWKAGAAGAALTCWGAAGTGTVACWGAGAVLIGCTWAGEAVLIGWTWGANCWNWAGPFLIGWSWGGKLLIGWAGSSGCLLRTLAGWNWGWGRLSGNLDCCCWKQ